MCRHCMGHLVLALAVARSAACILSLSAAAWTAYTCICMRLDHCLRCHTCEAVDWAGATTGCGGESYGRLLMDGRLLAAQLCTIAVMWMHYSGTWDVGRVIAPCPICLLQKHAVWNDDMPCINSLPWSCSQDLHLASRPVGASTPLMPLPIAWILDGSCLQQPAQAAPCAGYLFDRAGRHEGREFRLASCDGRGSSACACAGALPCSAAACSAVSCIHGPLH
jgi:hypothetical protein